MGVPSTSSVVLASTTSARLSRWVVPPPLPMPTPWLMRSSLALCLRRWTRSSSCTPSSFSLINSTPTIQTLLPLTPEGEVCDVNGNCVDATNDEVFKLTSKDGAFAVERDTIPTETASFEGTIVFEQDPNQILDALSPCT